MGRLSLAREREALLDFTIFTEEIASYAGLLSHAANDVELADRIKRVAARSAVALRREVLDKACTLIPRLERLAKHPKLSDIRFVSGELPDALVKAAEQLDDVRSTLLRLDLLDGSLTSVDLTKRLEVVLAKAERLATRLDRALKTLKVAKTAPIPDSDKLFMLRGSRQNGDTAVLWLEMRIGAESRQFVTLFALDQRGQVMNSSTRRAPWAEWDLLEFKFSDVALEQVAAVRIQFS